MAPKCQCKHRAKSPQRDQAFKNTGGKQYSFLRLNCQYELCERNFGAGQNTDIEYLCGIICLGFIGQFKAVTRGMFSYLAVRDPIRGRYCFLMCSEALVHS